MNKNVEDLVQELNALLNRMVRENQELRDIIRSIHAAGCNVQISFHSGRVGSSAVAGVQQDEGAAWEDPVRLHLSKEDILFLKSIKISVES